MRKLKNQIHDVLVQSGYECSWDCEKKHFLDVWDYVYVHKDDTLPVIYFDEDMDYIYADTPNHELDRARAEQVISYFNEYNSAHKKQDAVHVQSEYVNKWLSLASFINEEGTWIDKINQVLLANGFRRINGLPFTVSGLPSWDYIYYHELVNLYIYFNNYTKVGSAAVPYCIHAKYGDGSFHQLDNKSPEELLAYFQASITAPEQDAVNTVQQNQQDLLCNTSIASFMNQEDISIDKIKQVLLTNGFKNVNVLPYGISAFFKWDYIYYHDGINLYVYFDNATVNHHFVPWVGATYGNGAPHQLHNKTIRELLEYFTSTKIGGVKVSSTMELNSSNNPLLYGMSYMRKLQAYYHELIGALDSGDLTIANAAHDKLKQLLNDGTV